MLVHLQVIDEALAQDDEISTPELCALLNEVEGGEKVSISTVQRAKKDLGKTDFAWCCISLYIACAYSETYGICLNWS